MDWEFAHDTFCPKCGSLARTKDCGVCDADFAGLVDLHDEDPINYSIGSHVRCGECLGRGSFLWCGECGWNLVEKFYLNGRPENFDIGDKVFVRWWLFWFPAILCHEPSDDTFFGWWFFLVKFKIKNWDNVRPGKKVDRP